MGYTHSPPPTPSFEGKGLVGYTFGPLQQKNLEFYYIESEKGHDTFVVSKRIARTYYVVSGNGYFIIDGRRYDVIAGMLVEVPPKVEFSYSGRMKLVAFCMPRWFYGNDRHTRWNPDAVQEDLPLPPNGEPWKIFGRRVVNSCVRLTEWMWNGRSRSARALSPVHSSRGEPRGLTRKHGPRSQAQSALPLRSAPPRVDR